jgi:putative ATP-dependent endonuclease of OLD family
MYISEVWIRNYRCFQNTKVEFEPGVTVIIGENNGGKSSLLSAVQLVFEGGGARSLGRYDFYQGIEDFSQPPRISVTATLSSSEGEDTPAELGTVATWLTDIGAQKWEAKITYHFYLPDSQEEAFTKRIKAVDGSVTSDSFWQVVEVLLPRYVARIDAGQAGVEEPGYQRVEPRDLKVFSVDFLDAIRDAEQEMFGGHKPKLRAMLNAVLEEDADATAALEKEARKLVAELTDRVDDNTLFGLAKATGAADGGTPAIDGDLRERDLIRALRLIVENPHVGKLPISHNGLGYNNLLFISLILASLDMQSEEKVGAENAVVFPMLLIEEPEAHLHPALQFRLLKYVNKRIRDDGGSRQVFVTTHSTHVTSATGLDAIVSLAAGEDGKVKAAYPGRVFEALPNASGKESKAYVERFLDATKSTMLFSRGIILVEGISEQLLIPTLAEHCGYSLDQSHIAVVAIGGRTFKHFLPLFGAGLSGASLGLKRKVACIVDADPSQKKFEGAKFKKCYPYQLDRKNDYEYKSQSDVVLNLTEQVANCKNAKIFFGEKTLEYDLAFYNPQTPLLITEHCVYEKELRALSSSPDTVPEKLEGKVGSEVVDDMVSIDDRDEHIGHQFATFYLSCVSGKGEHAQALNLQIRSESGDRGLVVPEYIKNAITWVCE